MITPAIKNNYSDRTRARPASAFGPAPQNKTTKGPGKNSARYASNLGTVLGKYGASKGGKARMESIRNGQKSN